MYTRNIPMYLFTCYIISEALPLFILEKQSYFINAGIRLTVMIIACLYFESLIKARIKKMKEKDRL